MAVWASFPFDNRKVGPGDVRADWKWAMGQWDRVVEAGSVVRLVVADQAYSGLSQSTPEGQTRTADLRARVDACHQGEQLVFGRVYAAAGKLRLGQPGETVPDPLNPGKQVPGFVAQIEAWQAVLGTQLDGIFIDVGPDDCTNPSVPGSERAVPGNYGRYVDMIRTLGYLVFVDAVNYPDTFPASIGWLQQLQPDFIQIWEAGVLNYKSAFATTDPCVPDAPPVVPNWWDPGPSLRYARVQVVNDCRDAAEMTGVLDTAVNKRAVGNIWVTLPRSDASLGPVFDSLPPYFKEEVDFFRPIVQAEEQRFKDEKDVKDDKDGKDNKDAKNEKDAKDQKDEKDGKDDKDVKDQKDVKDDKDDKDNKDGKDNKDDKDSTKEEPKEKPEDKEDKENKDDADKAEKDDKDDPPEFLKDSESFKTAEIAFGVPPLPVGNGAAVEPESAPGRTFIRAHERPLVGERVVADPD
jgi:hypothetical protein